VSDTFTYSLKLREDYAKSLGRYNSNTPILSIDECYRLSDVQLSKFSEMIGDSIRNPVMKYIGTYYTGNREPIYIIPKNKGLHKLIEISTLPQLYKKIDNWLDSIKCNWSIFDKMYKAYNSNNTMKIDYDDNTFYNQIKLYKNNPTLKNMIRYSKESDAVGEEFNLDRINDLNNLIKAILIPTSENISAVIEEYETLFTEPEELLEAMSQIYKDCTGYSFIGIVNYISDLINVLHYCIKEFYLPENKEFNNIFLLIYDEFVTDINRCLSELYRGRNVINTLNKQSGQDAYTVLPLLLERLNDLKLSFCCKISKEFISEDIDDEFYKSVEEFIKTSKISEQMSIIERCLPSYIPKVENKYLLGEDYFYRSIIDNRLIITAINNDIFIVKNSIYPNLKLRRNDKGDFVWEIEGF